MATRKTLKIDSFMAQSQENALAAEKEAIENIQVEQKKEEAVVVETIPMKEEVVMENKSESPSKTKPLSRNQRIKIERPFQKSIHFTKTDTDNLETAKYFLSKNMGEKISIEEIIYNVVTKWLNKNIQDIENGKVVKW